MIIKLLLFVNNIFQVSCAVFRCMLLYRAKKLQKKLVTASNISYAYFQKMFPLQSTPFEN